MVSRAQALLSSRVSFIAGSEPWRLDGAGGFTTTGAIPEKERERERGGGEDSACKCIE